MRVSLTGRSDRSHLEWCVVDAWMDAAAELGHAVAVGEGVGGDGAARAVRVRLGLDALLG
eukprot:6185060-Pleurochrysis_carterae.AAC.2